MENNFCSFAIRGKNLKEMLRNVVLAVTVNEILHLKYLTLKKAGQDH